MSSLIIGASGYIGSVLLRRMKEQGEEAIGAYHSRPVEGMVRFDLSKDDPAKIDLDWNRVRSVVICTALSSLEEYVRKKEYARAVNVEGMARLFRFAATRKLHVLFLSSEYIYDGTPAVDGRPRCHLENETPGPTTEYGIEKVEAERDLAATVQDYFIARISKNVGVVRGDKTQFTGWAETLLKGDKLKLAHDQRFCCTWVEDTVRAMRTVLKQRGTGLYNMASPESASRYEWGEKLCRTLSVPTSQLESCSIRDFQFSEPRPLDISMNTETFQRDFNFKFTPAEAMLSLVRENCR